MMKHFITIVFGLVAMINFSACKKDRLTANGNVISETREMAQFTGISSSGATPIKITYGSAFKVVVKGSSNLLPHFTTRVVNNILYLNFEHVNIRRDDVEVELTMPVIKKISLSGSGQVVIKGSYPQQQQLAVSLSGSAEVEVLDPMQSEHVEVEISGSGDVHLQKVATRQAKANISGSGSVKFQVADLLQARISGSGRVYYSGNPSVQQEISGSGKIIKL